MSTDESRRKFLQNVGLGYRLARRPGPVSALGGCRRPLESARAETPPLPATAKRVISLFMQGGPSQVDTFDPKPLLTKLHGQHPPDSFGNEDFQNGKLRDSIILGTKTNIQEARRNRASKYRICCRISRRRPMISR